MAYTDSAPSTDAGPIKGKEAKKPSARMRRYWREIEAYNKAAEEWKIQGETIVKLYLDQHRRMSSPRKFALLWSNIETLKPAVYGKLPTVLCSRRYKDAHPTGRIAAELLERASNTTFDLYRADEVFRMVRDDRLLVGRGQAWVRYEADIEKLEDDKDEPYERVNYEKACIDYVHWTDFGHNVCGTWKDVWVVWRRVYKSRDEVKERFGREIADKLTYSSKPNYSTDTDPEGGEDKAAIFEIWDKRRKQVVWMSRDCPDMLDEGDPPLNFRDFFPCPEPCYGSKASKSLIPTPDYRYYQDQADEIDDLTEKIANLTDFLIVRGFIPAGPSADGADAVRMLIQQMQSDMTANKTTFIPVESWAGFAEKGGARGLIDWMPVEQVIVALKGAIQSRQQLIQDVYQITGISDILRGETDPDETLGAQQLKAQTGSRRVRNAKDDLSRFCKDVAQLVAEIVAEQFSAKTIADMTGFAYQPPVAPPGMFYSAGGVSPPAPMQQPQSPSGQTFDDQVLELLRNDRMRGFLIDIETDSTIQPDEDAEKQRRTEFITAVGAFLRQAVEVVGAAPGTAPMISEMLLFTVRGFRAGRSLEEVIERSMQTVQQQAAQPRPDPDAHKNQIAERKLLIDERRLQVDEGAKQAETQAKQQEAAMKLETARIQQEAVKAEAALRLQQLQSDLITEFARKEERERIAFANEERRKDAEAAALLQRRMQAENDKAADEIRRASNGKSKSKQVRGVYNGKPVNLEIN
jgi:hypothetical protein